MKLVVEMKEEAEKNMVGFFGNQSAKEGDGGVLISMSALKEEGVITVKNVACESLLEKRVVFKMKSKKINSCLNKIKGVMQKPRDGKGSLPCIPQFVLDSKILEELEKEEWLRMRERSSGVEENTDVMDIDQPNKKRCLLSRSISRSKPPSEIVLGEGYKDSTQKLKAIKLGKKASKKRNKDASKGEGDRVI
ncbi:hypothetical protein KI387_013711, partial [Taxus chinensis]